MTELKPGVPAAGDIQDWHGNEEDEVKQRKTPSRLRRYGSKGSGSIPFLMCGTHSQEVDEQGEDVNKGNVQQIIKERHPAKDGQRLGHPATSPFGKRDKGDRRPKCHQQEELRCRILLLIQ